MIIVNVLVIILSTMGIKLRRDGDIGYHIELMMIILVIVFS